jgi:hypothetical protein
MRQAWEVEAGVRGLRVHAGTERNPHNAQPIIKQPKKIEDTIL